MDFITAYLIIALVASTIVAVFMLDFAKGRTPRTLFLMWLVGSLLYPVVFVALFVYLAYTIGVWLVKNEKVK